MTTHKYPAVLPPQAQETIHDIISRLQAYLEQREIAHQELRRQNEQLSASLQAERAAHEATKRERDELLTEGAAMSRALAGLKEAMELRAGFQAQIAFIEHERDALQRQLGETQAALAVAEQGVRDG